MNRWAGLFQLVLCNIRGYIREPEAIFWAYGFPLLMVVGLGIAFERPSEKPVELDAVDGPATQQILAPLKADPAFKVQTLSREEALLRLRRNQTPVVVIVSETGELEYHFDPSNPEGKIARDSVNEAIQRAGGRRDAVAVTDVKAEEPGSRYIDFLVPGLIGMNLMGGGMWGVGFMLVDMRLKKLLKRLLGTPMRRSDFLLSVVATRVLFFIPEAFVLLSVSVLIFKIPIQGNLVTVALVAFVGAMTFAGLGLLAASRAQRIETISGILNVVMLPMWLCSGIFFSSDRFPTVMQPFIQALPLTQLIDALRAVILDGQPLPSLGLPLGVLVVWCAGSFAVALKWFRWS